MVIEKQANIMTGDTKDNNTVNVSENSNKENKDTNQQPKKNSFIVEAETVNTESATILTSVNPPATSNSEIGSVVSPVTTNEREVLLSNDQLISSNEQINQIKEERLTNISDERIQSVPPHIEPQLQLHKETDGHQVTNPNIIAYGQTLGSEGNDTSMIPKRSESINNSKNVTGVLPRPSIIATSSKESSSNSLIDNNPLPIPSHTNNILLKNKKSSLLVDSQDILNSGNNNNALDEVVDEVLKDPKPSMSLISNPMLDNNIASSIGNNNTNNEKKLFKKSGGSNTDDKDKLMDKVIDPRPVSKIIERPIMASMNSRDLLLNESKNNNIMDEDTNNKTSTPDNGLIPLNNNIHNEKKLMKKDDDKNKIITKDDKLKSDLKNPSVGKDIKPPSVFESLLKPDDKKAVLSDNEDRSHSNDVSNNNNDNEENDTKKINTKNTNGKNTNNNNVSSPEEDNTIKPNKTDFFAARLATAVGENEISDSEETFVYESAANSTKNLIYPNASNMGQSSNQINDLRSGHNINDGNESNMINNNHGIPTKMSVPLLNTNKKLMNRLKNTRHTSTGGILSHASLHGSQSHFAPNAKSQLAPVAQAPSNAVNATSSLNTDVNPSNLVTSTHDTSISKPVLNQNSLYSLGNYGPVHNDDIPSIRSVNNNNNNNNNNGDKGTDIQSVRSFIIEQHQNRSPDKRTSTLSLNKPPVGNSSLPMGSVQRTSHLKLDPTSSTKQDGKKIGDNKRVLRTTVSKIFDNNGTPLRRYSGVPDNVNLEDYIEQTDDLGGVESLRYEYSLAHPSGRGLNRNDDEIYNNEGGDSKRFSNGSNHIVNNWNMSPGTYYVHDTSAIKEEDEDEFQNKNANNTSDYLSKKKSVIKNSNMNQDPSHFHNNNNPGGNEDDVHSTFYYNHRTDLEARPQISDYEDDEMDPDGDDGMYAGTIGSAGYHTRTHTDQGHVPYYGTNSNNNSKGNGYKNGKNIPHGYYDYVQGNGYANEYTPLRHSTRKRTSRNQFNFSPHDFTTKKSTFTKFKNALYYIVLVLVLLFTGFSFGFILATNKELQDFDIILLDNVISSAEELIFDITVSAFNPGLFAITMDSLDVDVFGKSEPVLDTEALYLGNIDEFESPLTIDGGFFTRRYSASTTALKIVSPGNSTASDNLKWRKLIRHDYELVLRGTMKYTIPFFDTERSVTVQKSTTISGRNGRSNSGTTV